MIISNCQPSWSEDRRLLAKLEVLSTMFYKGVLVRSCALALLATTNDGSLKKLLYVQLVIAYIKVHDKITPTDN